MKENSLVAAINDLRARTLATLSSEMARLVYLSSTRDYLTGRYYHDGLAFRFRGGVGETAVGVCHRELFEKISTSPLSELVRELEVFIRSQHAEPREVLNAWKELEPFRMLVPQSSNSVSRELFFSNVRVALATLECRLKESPLQDIQASSQPR